MSLELDPQNAEFHIPESVIEGAAESQAIPGNLSDASSLLRHQRQLEGGEQLSSLKERFNLVNAQAQAALDLAGVSKDSWVDTGYRFMSNEFAELARKYIEGEDLLHGGFASLLSAEPSELIDDIQVNEGVDLNMSDENGQTRYVEIKNLGIFCISVKYNDRAGSANTPKFIKKAKLTYYRNADNLGVGSLEVVSTETVDDIKDLNSVELSKKIIIQNEQYADIYAICKAAGITPKED